MSSKENIEFSDLPQECLMAKSEIFDSVDPRGVFNITCRSSDGSILWEEECKNLVVNAGRNDILNQYFRGLSYSASFFVGLKTAGSINALDTMPSKSWTEITLYSNATRPAYTTVASTARSITNSASPAVFNINGSATVGGCFITTNNVPGGTTGTLFSAVDFASARIVASSDTLTVTYTVSC